MGEFELIRNYFAAAPCAQGGEGVALGIGDDCALLAVPPGSSWRFPPIPWWPACISPTPAIRFCSASARWPWPSATWPPWAPTPIAFTLALTTADRRLPIGCKRYAQGLNPMAQSCGVGLVGGDTTARAAEPDHDRVRPRAGRAGVDP